MFKKLLSSLGIGAATINTHLHDDTIMPGQMVSGETHVVGGDIEQAFNGLYVYINTRYKHEDSVHQYTLAHQNLGQPFSLRAKETRVLPFSFALPYQTPLTLQHQRVHVHTGLDVSSAIDPSDADTIQVIPHPLQQAVFSAIQGLGFQLYHSENEYNPHRGSPYPFVQEFEFRPFGMYSGRVQELEIVFKLYGDYLDVLVEVDRKARGMAGIFEAAMDLNERWSQLHITPADLQRGSVQPMLQQLINQAIS